MHTEKGVQLLETDANESLVCCDFDSSFEQRICAICMYCVADGEHNVRTVMEDVREQS